MLVMFFSQLPHHIGEIFFQCFQVADGMAFLHSTKYTILHRDLRCANILVDNSERVKVGTDISCIG